MATERLVRIEALAGTLDARPCPVTGARLTPAGGQACGIDVGSTTCKFVLYSREGRLVERGYERHGTKQADKVLEFLRRLEKDHNLTPHQDRIFFTGSGSGSIAPLVGGRTIQEVVAVAAAVEKLHPDVRFVSEIGGEDMKTIFFNGDETNKR